MSGPDEPRPGDTADFVSSPSPRRLPGVTCPHAVTDRAGGVSVGPYASLDLGLHCGDRRDHVLENRRRLATALELDPRHLTFAEQTHGAGVAVVGLDERGRGALDHADALPGVDALVTREPGVPLVLLAADCVLVLLHDPVAGGLGIAHAGWRGTAGGVVETTVAEMVGLGAVPGRMEAALSPAIGACCYEVSEEVARAVGEEHGVVGEGGGVMLDLPGAVMGRLGRVGVGWVGESPGCTRCGSERWFSYRGAGGGGTGRHAVVGWLG